MAFCTPYGYNDIFDNGGAKAKKQMMATDDQGNIAADPLFTDAYGDDFHLLTGSPAIDTGHPDLTDADGTRSDMGAYGGPWRGEYSSCDMPPCDVPGDDDGGKADYIPLAPQPDPSTTPVAVYRLFSQKLNTHHYCGEVEKDYLLSTYPPSVWKLEGVAFYVYRNADLGVAPVYRLYSEFLQEHLFTTDSNEKEVLTSAPDPIWRYEGVAFYVNTTDDGGLLPVYRLYNIKTQNHLLTTDANEMEKLSSKEHWNYEGVAYYVDGAGD